MDFKANRHLTGKAVEYTYEQWKVNSEAKEILS